jgi:hypothetical protein
MNFFSTDEARADRRSRNRPDRDHGERRALLTCRYQVSSHPAGYQDVRTSTDDHTVTADEQIFAEQQALMLDSGRDNSTQSAQAGLHTAIISPH